MAFEKMKDADILQNLTKLHNDKLVSFFPNSQIETFNKNESDSGIQSTIYFFRIAHTNTSSGDNLVNKLVLKVYDGIISDLLFDPGAYSKIEYEVLLGLQDSDLYTPRVYAHGGIDNEYFHSPFIVMDFIEGTAFYKYYEKLLANKDIKKIHLLFDKINLYLVKINSIDYLRFREIFPQAITDNEKNSYLIHDIGLWKELLREKDIAEEIFEPLLKWILDYGKNIPLEKYSLVNRDFKLSNFLINQDEEPVLLDWSISYITDYRLALGYGLMLIELHNDAHITKEQFLLSYEKIHNKKLDYAEFFEAIALIKNLGIQMIILNRTTEEEFKKDIQKDMKESFTLLQEVSGQLFPGFESYLQV